MNGLLNRTIISKSPVPEFRFPNSEFRMGYGGFGIPHHKISDRGDDPETDFGMIGNGVTGWDMGCRTLEFYVNNLAKEGTRKEGKAGVGCRYYRGNKKPRRVEPTGHGGELSGSIARKGTKNKKQSEKQTQG